MTSHASRLLRKLKRAQRTEDNTVHIDGKTMKAITQDATKHSPVEVSLKAYKTSLSSTLQYLHSEGYIEHRMTFTQVTAKGWHYDEERFSAFCAFLAKSVLVPIVVSAVTALITIWIKQNWG